MSDRSDAARDILSIPLCRELFAEMERAAVNAAVFAEYDDHEARQAHMSEVRAIRNLLGRLEAISQEGQSTPRRKAPA